MDIIWYKNFFPSWILAGTTTKSFGDIKNLDNQKKLAKILDIASSNLYSLKQEHTVIIREIGIDSRLPLGHELEAEWRGNGLRSQILLRKTSGSLIGDGLFTQEKNIGLLIKTADCVPVLIVDIKEKRIMALHAGRKGIATGIITKGMDILFSKRSHPENLQVLLGPFIEKKCYDACLEQLIRQDLKRYHIPEKNILVSGECTYCNSDKYFSYRRGDSQRMGSFVMML